MIVRLLIFELFNFIGYDCSTVDIESVLKNDTKLHILDYASDSSSDDDMPTISNTWKGADMDGSDNESVDSINDDVLK